MDLLEIYLMYRKNMLRIVLNAKAKLSLPVGARL